MMFLFRLAFCFAVIALFVPTGKDEPAASIPQIGAGEAFVAASAAFSDFRQFCARQPDACSVGSQAAAIVGQKAQAAAKMAFEFIAGQATSETGAVAAHGKGSGAGGDAGEGARSTLTEADRALPWRGQQPRSALLVRNAS